MKYVKTTDATNQIARKKLLDKFLKKHKIYLSFYRNTKQYSGFTVDRLIACRENPAGLMLVRSGGVQHWKDLIFGTILITYGKNTTKGRKGEVMLDKKMLTDMPPYIIFARGEIIDAPEGINMTNSGRMLKWVACRGQIDDWAIYTHYTENSWDYVKSFGDTVTSQKNIKKLVPCDDEAFKLYRY